MNAPAWLTARPIAHRGLHDRAAGIVENSLPAARSAIAHGFAIECDVQDTADGEAVVFHDYRLERLTGAAGAVRERRLAEIDALVLSASAASDRIPTLAAFLAEVAGRVPVVVEIKSRFDGDMTLARRTAEIALACSGPVALKSFDPAVVAALRDLTPGIPRGIVAESAFSHPEWQALDATARHEMANLLHLPRTSPDFVSWYVGDLPCAAPFLCRHLGHMPLMTWTVRSDDDVARARLHADQIVFEGFVPSP